MSFDPLFEEARPALNNLDEHYVEYCRPLDDRSDIEFNPDPEEAEVTAPGDGLTYNAFWSGANYYNNSALRAVDNLLKTDLPPQEKIVLGAVRFAAHTVRTKHRGLTHRTSFMDRAQNANEYLTEAASKFDASAGVKFLGFAGKLIDIRINAFERGISPWRNDGELIRVHYDQREYYAVRELKERLTAKFGREIEADELAQFMNRQLDDPAARAAKTASQIQNFIDMHKVHVSYEEYFADGTGRDIPAEPAETPYERETAAQVINTILNQNFREKEAGVLKARLGLDGSEPVSLAALAQTHNVSTTTIDNVIKKSLIILRRTPNILNMIMHGEVPDAAAVSKPVPISKLGKK